MGGNGPYRKLTAEQRLEIAQSVLKIGAKMTGARWGIGTEAVCSLYYKYAKKGVVDRIYVKPRFTDAEDDVLRVWAPRYNQRSVELAEIAKAVSAVGTVKRGTRSIWGRLKKLGLLENIKTGTRRERAEAAYFQPYATIQERDLVWFEDYVCPDCVTTMLAGLVERIENGNPPSVTWQLNGKKELESDGILQHEFA